MTCMSNRDLKPPHGPVSIDDSAPTNDDMHLNTNEGGEVVTLPYMLVEGRQNVASKQLFPQ